MSITADLKASATRVRQGGGKVYIASYDAAKDPYQPHASLKTAYTAGGTSLVCYRAPQTDTHVPASFSATPGHLDVDIFGGSGVAEANKACSALGAADNTFTVTALANNHAVDAVVKLYDADDYAITDFKELGSLGGTELDDSTPSNSVYDETGLKVGSFAGNRDMKFVTAMMQSGKAELDFLLVEAVGMTYCLKYVVDVGSDGTQIIVVRAAKLITDMKAAFKNATDRVISVSFEIIADGANRPFVVYEG